MPALLLHDLPFEIVTLEARLLLCSTPAGFPSPAADDIEEPIDLGTWLIEQPAASYVMRVDGTSMAGAGINNGDLIVVSRAKKPRPGHIVVALVHGDCTLKLLKKVEDRLWLIAEKTIAKLDNAATKKTPLFDSIADLRDEAVRTWALDRFGVGVVWSVNGATAAKPAALGLNSRGDGET